MAKTSEKHSIHSYWQAGGLIAVVILLACSSGAQVAAASGGNGGTGAPTVDPAPLRIGPGDLLELSVFDVPELAQVLRVSDTGTANLLLVGPLHLDGLTAAEAQGLIEYRLRQGSFILDPHVSLIIREYGTQGVSVLGEVRKPGVYQVLGRRNLLDVISEAGGITPFAGQQATIKRRGSPQTLSASLSNDPAELLARDIELHPGDTVIVPKAGIVYVLGDVGRAGGYVMQNSGRISLLEAIAMAQGVNRTAAKKHTRLIRKSASGVQEISLDLKHVLEGRAPDLALEPEDIVYIPPSTAKSIVMRDAPSLMQSTASAAIYQAMP